MRIRLRDPAHNTREFLRDLALAQTMLHRRTREEIDPRAELSQFRLNILPFVLQLLVRRRSLQLFKLQEFAPVTSITFVKTVSSTHLFRQRYIIHQNLSLIPPAPDLLDGTIELLQNRSQVLNFICKKGQI